MGTDEVKVGEGTVSIGVKRFTEYDEEHVVLLQKAATEALIPLLPTGTAMILILADENEIRSIQHNLPIADDLLPAALDAALNYLGDKNDSE